MTSAVRVLALEYYLNVNKGYSYRSPMARNLQIPIYDSDDEISDNDLGLDSKEISIFQFSVV